jgi:hypothetical protein
MTDEDNDIGFDHQPLNNIIGENAEDALGEDSGQWSDIKAVPRKSKSCSHKKVKKKLLVGRNKKHFK